MSDDLGCPAFDLSKLDLSESTSRRKSVTAKSVSTNFQGRRRKEALLKQQQARDDRTQQARRLALQKNDSQVLRIHSELNFGSSTILILKV